MKKIIILFAVVLVISCSEENFTPAIPLDTPSIEIAAKIKTNKSCRPDYYDSLLKERDFLERQLPAMKVLERWLDVYIIQERLKQINVRILICTL